MLPLVWTRPRRPLQLHVIVEQADLLAGLERRQANVRAAVAAERVAERAVAARADLALDSKVHLGEVVGGELEAGERLVRLGALGGVLGLEALCQAAGAVLAGTTTLAGLGLAFGRCDVVCQ